MNEWVILKIEPALAWMNRDECVPRFDQATYTLREMRTGHVKRITCGLRDQWVDRFLMVQSPGIEVRCRRLKRGSVWDRNSCRCMPDRSVSAHRCGGLMEFGAARREPCRSRACGRARRHSASDSTPKGPEFDRTRPVRGRDDNRFPVAIRDQEPRR